MTVNDSIEGVTMNLHADGTVTYTTENEYAADDIESTMLGVWTQDRNQVQIGVTGFRTGADLCAEIATAPPPAPPTCKLVGFLEGTVVDGQMTLSSVFGAANVPTDGPSLFEIPVDYELTRLPIDHHRSRFSQD